LELRVYNTLARKKEQFAPRQPHHVRMYVCGPTTYNYFHLGNARALVVFDTVRRYLLYRGFRVTYVQNFTDIDDKIIRRAAEEGEDPGALAARYTREYFRDADALRVLHADVHPKATEHIEEMQEMVRVLLAKKAAYVLDGDVYFSVRKFPGYGKLSGRTLEEMLSGARVEVDERKQDPLDFVLWKSAKPGEPSWNSPWGPGRPGWHLECSVMSSKYLGFGFDIHGGGSDLVFPHHENEIAQAEAYQGGSPFARYWMHNGFVTVNDEKMSKSLGNFFIVRDLLQEWPPEVLRFFLLSTHYRSPLDYNTEALELAQRSYNRLRNTLDLIEEITGGQEAMPAGRFSRDAGEFRRLVLGRVAEFEEAMDDDFNTALAIAALFNLGRDVNTFINRDDFTRTPAAVHILIHVRRYFISLLDVLGLIPGESRELGEDSVEQLRQIIAGLKPDERKLLPKNLPGEPRALLDLLLQARETARRQKNYTLSDQLRDRLLENGILLEDTPRGVRWRLV
jgi:cysteinyl-tRNA synthetase